MVLSDGLLPVTLLSPSHLCTSALLFPVLLGSSEQPLEPFKRLWGNRSLGAQADSGDCIDSLGIPGVLTTRGLGVGSPWRYDGTYFAALGEGGEELGEESLYLVPSSCLIQWPEQQRRLCVARQAALVNICAPGARPPMGEAGRGHGWT